MSGAGGHRDRGYTKWWIGMAAVVAATVGIVYLAPFILSPQPEQELESQPTSITEVDPTNSSDQQSGAQAGQQTGNVPVPEESPPIGSQEATTDSQQ